MKIGREDIHRNWKIERAGGSRDAGPKDGGVVLTGIRPWAAAAKVLVILGKLGEPRT